MPVSQKGESTLVFDTATKAVVEMSKRLPGKKRWKNGNLFVDATGNNLQEVLATFPTIAEAGLPVVDLYLGARSEGARVRSQKAATLPAEASAYPYKTQPFGHQRQAFALSRDSEYFAYFMEMGTGKSKLNVDVAGHLWLQGHIDIVVVLAPNGVHRQWVREAFPQHMSDSVPWSGWAHSSKKRVRDKQELAEVLSSKGLRVITIASESLSSKSAQEFLQDLVIQYGKRMLLIVDESHMYANASTSRTSFLLDLAPSIAFRRILTGSPITDGIEKLFPQYKILSPAVLGHRSQTSFNREFCSMEQIYGAPRGAMRIVGYQNLKRLVDLVEGCTYRVTKDECLDLPEKVYIRRDVEWDPKQRNIYLDLIKYASAEIQGKEVSAPLAITLLTKLQQVLGGSVIGDEGEDVEVPTNKLTALQEIVESNPRGGIIWVKYLSEARRVEGLLKKLGKSYGMYIGSTSQDERSRITERGAVDWLIANDSASTGLDLPWWDLCVYYSNTFNAAVRWQSEDRIHRIGQKNRCTYIDLVVPNSVDEVVIEALRRKRETADYVWIPEELLRDTLSVKDEK